MRNFIVEKIMDMYGSAYDYFWTFWFSIELFFWLRIKFFASRSSHPITLLPIERIRLLFSACWKWTLHLESQVLKVTSFSERSFVIFQLHLSCRVRERLVKNICWCRKLPSSEVCVLCLCILASDVTLLWLSLFKYILA